MKVKKFSHKLLALFMAIVMVLTCLTGALTSYGASSDTEYNDGAVTYNSLAWKVLSDEQTATALLDYADSMLAQYGTVIDDLIAGFLPSSGVYYWKADARQFVINAAGIITENIDVRLHSVDELLSTLESVEDVLRRRSGLLGDAGNLQLSSTAGMRRSNTSSCDIIRGILGILEKNSADYNGKDVLGEFLRGGFDLGTLGSIINVDIYGAIGGLLGLDSGYQSNLIYNLVQGLLFNYTKWFTDEEIANYKAHPETFNFDEVLLDKMSSELLSKINVLVTYPDGTSSKSRLAEIEAIMEDGSTTYAQAAEQLGYDPNLVYSSEESQKGNVLLFEYGQEDAKEHLVITKDSNLLDFGYQALDLAWKTVLRDTVKLLHVNNNVDRGHGANFDNVYLYWAQENLPGGWNENDLPSMYSETNINNFAKDKYEAYGFDTADEFLDYVKNTYEFNRKVVDEPNYNWRDIDETTLFNKLRYSPLADYGFDMQTGPINLYFMQTGTDNLDAFFEKYTDPSQYNSMIAALNNALVAAVKDIFPDRDNIYKDTKGDTNRPALAETSITPSTPLDSTTNLAITNTLVSNALDVVQYTADVTDQNILSGFYHGGGEELTEQNIESAMVPLLVACIGQINLGSGQLQKLIHPEDWDSCQDAEGVIYTCLEEYLSYVLPEKDYEGKFTESGAVSVDDGKLTVSYEDAILPMARDAVVYVMEASVPVTYKGEPWKVKSDNTFSSDATIFDLLNSVVCYYANDYQLTSGRSMGVASLLGICDKQGNSLIKESNTLWENIDLVVNSLLPVVGTLQYGTDAKYGQASSEDLIYNDIIKGVLNIGETSIHSSGLGGVSNFINKFLTIVTAPPIAKKALELTIYDLLKDLLNGLLGPRYDNQTFVPIPDAASATPFNDLLQKNVICGTDGGNVGVIQKAICNFVEFTGFGPGGTTAYPDSVLRGFMFALQALNSFMPEVIPSIGDHQFNMATAVIENPTVSNVGDEPVESNLVITNNCIGVNNAYVDASNIIHQHSRYYVKITDITTNNPEKAEVDYDGQDITLDPTKSARFATSAVIDGDNTTYEYIFTYDVVDNEGHPISENLTDLQGFVYQNLSSDVSWRDTVYPGGTNQFDPALEVSSAGGSATSNGYKTYATGLIGANSRLYVTYPEYVVTSVNSASELDSLQLRISNTGSNDDTIDGWYMYDEATVKNNENSDVTVGVNNPIPVWDPATGDLLNKTLYDYSLDGGKEWNRGDNNKGYNNDEISQAINDNPGSDFVTRTHVAYTFAEAQKAGIIASYNLIGGEYQNIYLQSGTDNLSTVIQRVSMKGPADGLYLNSRSVTQGSGSGYFQFVNKDQSADVPAGTYNFKVCFYSSNSKATTDNMTLVVGDDSNALSLSNRYNELSQLIANYKSSDFSDEGIYTEARQILSDALSTESIVLTPDTAKGMNDKTVLTATTSNTTSEYGDIAFVPFTSENADTYQMPQGVKNNAYLHNGIYYFDENHTMPIYSREKLTDKDVQDGKDAAGIPVIKAADGTYHLKNMPAYEYEWTKEYGTPYYAETEKQATNSNGDLLYKQVQYVYRNKDSNKVNSTDDWYAKFPVTTYQLVPNQDGQDNRGTYSKSLNALEYAIYILQNNVKPEIALQLLNEISIPRHGLNSNNFDIASYNRMVAAAKKAEDNYQIVINFTGEDGEEYTHTVPFSDYYGYVDNENITIHSTSVKSSLSSIQVAENVRLFNMYTGFVLERGYRGEQLEKEILCASGNNYSALVAEVATYSDDGERLTEASVTRGPGAADAKYGTWSSSGELVNDDGAGNKLFTDESWDNYINALADAVALATHGNTDYTHKASAPYVIAEKDTYDAQVTGCYTKDCALQMAEIALAPYVASLPRVTVTEVEGGSVTVNGTPYTEPVEVESGSVVTLDATADPGYTFGGFNIGGSVVQTKPYRLVVNEDVTVTPIFNEVSGHTVSGSIVVATRPNGTTTNKTPYGEYTFTLYSNSDRTDEVTSFNTVYDPDAKTNTFSTTLADGTYYATLKGEYSIAREDITIIVNGSDISGAVIPVIACDFNKDGRITSVDTNSCMRAAAGLLVAPYCDLDSSGTITSVDTTIVTACGSQNASYPAITIE